MTNGSDRNQEFARRQWLWLITGQRAVFSIMILARSRSLARLVMGRITPPARPAFVIGCLVPTMTGEALALGLAAPLAVVALAAVLTGLAIGAQEVIISTAIQVNVGPDVLARVAAIDLVGSEGSQPIGYALAGPVAAAVGARAFLTASALGVFAAATAFAFLRPLRVTIQPAPSRVRNE